MELDREQTDLFLRRQHQEIRPSQLEAVEGGGPVIVRYRGAPLGLATLRLPMDLPRT